MCTKTGTDTEKDLKEQSLGRRPNQQAPPKPSGAEEKPLGNRKQTPLQAALFSLCEKKEKGVEDDENCKLFWNSTPLQADNSLHQTERSLHTWPAS